MSSTLVSVRYPMGGTEFQLSDKTPQVGDVLRRNGDNWVVETVTVQENGSTSVTLRPGLKPKPRTDGSESA